MNQLINSFISAINEFGGDFCNFAGSMFIQSSMLILLLLITDFLIRKHVRATFRYWIWMLVFIKLVLPPTLSSPTGVGYWVGGYFTTASAVSEKQLDIVHSEPVVISTMQQSPEPVEIPVVQTTPPATSVTPAVPVVPVEAGLNSLSSQGVVFMLWLVGVLVITVLLIQRVFFVRGLIAQSEPARGRLVDMLNLCRERVGVHRDIKLRLSHNVTSPAVCGLFRPVILVPKNLLEKLSQDKLKAVLIHELAHIKRGDLWINCVQTLLQIVYFYNPFVWLANTIVRRIREQAVDEMVLVALGTQAENYSNTLIDVAEMAFSRPVLSLRLVGVVESKKALSHRIKHILGRPFPKSAKLGIIGLLAIIIAAAVLLPMAKADRKTNAAKPEQDSKKYIATLPNGVTVELVGLCKQPVDDAQWWKPDGGEMAEPSFGASKRALPMEAVPTRYAFLAKTQGGEDISARMKIYEGFGWSTKVAEDGSALCYVKHPADSQPYREDAFEKGPIEIGVAQGQWIKGRGAPSPNMQIHRSYLIGSDDQIIIQPPQPEKSSPDMATTFWATTSSKDYEYRLNCTLKDGSIKTCMEPLFQSAGVVETGGISNGKLHTISFNIDRPLDQIASYELLYRKFEYARFNNVAFKPGLQTDVQIEFEGVDIQAEEENLRDLIDLEVNSGGGSRVNDDLHVWNIKIQNTGTKASGPFKMAFYPGAPSTTKAHIHFIPSINAGGFWIEQSGPFKLKSEGVDTLYAVIDPDNEVRESDEANNVLSVRLIRSGDQTRKFYTNIISGIPVVKVNSEDKKTQIVLSANVFSVNAPVSLITDYLRDELGVNNTASEMTDTQVIKLKKWMETVPDTTMISSPSVLVFDGETAKMSVTTNERPYTTDYEKTSDSPSQYKPIIKYFSTGIELDFTPALTKDKSIIHLSMKFNKTDLIKVEEKKHESGNMIQLPMRTNSEITTQVAVLAGKYFLVSVAGMHPAKNSTQPDQSSNQIFLLVKADVQDKAEQSNEKMPAGMVGTWFFDNPMGDDEQMAIFPDGRVVVLYSNGHKDQSRYENGFIELAEHDNARFKISMLEDGSLVQFHLDRYTGGLAKRWRRIDHRPKTKLLKSLTEGDYNKSGMR